MALTLNITISRIENHLTEVIDPRSNDLFLGSSPYPTVGLIALYLILVKYTIPRYMKNRPAYSLSSVLVYYNIFQVLLSAYLFYMCVIASGYGRRYSFFRCRDIDRSNTDPDTVAAMYAVHHFYLSKFTEFLDTIFFALRKKDNQITFLHLYHHATMPFNTWIVVRLSPGGSVVLAMGINASIHVFMYTYYLLSGLGPRWQKYLWWKKYMTTFQIIQFIYIIIATYGVYLTRSDCPILIERYPAIIYFVLYLFSLLVLFTHFYIASYKKKNT